MTRHGTYTRYTDLGTEAPIPRWYCPKAQCTFSLLADCFAAGRPGTLDHIEQAVTAYEAGRPSVGPPVLSRCSEVAVQRQWLRRQVRCLTTVLTVLIGLYPQQLAGCEPTLSSFRQRMAQDRLLVALRGLGAGHLDQLPGPLGFARNNLQRQPLSGHQQCVSAIRAPPRL